MLECRLRRRPKWTPDQPRSERRIAYRIARAVLPSPHELTAAATTRQTPASSVTPVCKRIGYCPHGAVLAGERRKGGQPWLTNRRSETLCSARSRRWRRRQDHHGQRRVDQRKTARASKRGPGPRRSERGTTPSDPLNAAPPGGHRPTGRVPWRCAKTSPPGVPPGLLCWSRARGRHRRPRPPDVRSARLRS